MSDVWHCDLDIRHVYYQHLYWQYFFYLLTDLVLTHTQCSFWQHFYIDILHCDLGLQITLTVLPKILDIGSNISMSPPFKMVHYRYNFFYEISACSVEKKFADLYYGIFRYFLSALYVELSISSQSSTRASVSFRQFYTSILKRNTIKRFFKIIGCCCRCFNKNPLLKVS